MFRSNMKESLTNKVEVPDADPDAFRGMLQYIYGGMAPENLDAVAMELLAIADKYGLETLKSMCEFSIRRNLNADTVVDACLLAERFDCAELMSHAKLVLKANIRVIERSEENRDKLKNDPDLLFKLFVQFADK